MKCLGVKGQRPVVGHENKSTAAGRKLRKRKETMEERVWYGSRGRRQDVHHKCQSLVT